MRNEKTIFLGAKEQQPSQADKGQKIVFGFLIKKTSSVSQNWELEQG